MNIVIKASIYLWSLLTQSIHKGIDANIFISNNLLQDLFYACQFWRNEFVIN